MFKKQSASNLSTTEVIYTPDSSLRSPRRLFAEMRRDLVASRELAWRLTVRDISAKYRQAWLGIAWAFLPPIAITAVFVLLNSQHLLNSGQTSIPYTAFVLLGTVFWQLFSEALEAPLRVVNESKSLLTKVNFPVEALIISVIMQVLFNFLIKLSLIALVFFYYKIQLPWTAIFAPFAISALLLLGITLGLLLVPIGMLYTDISQGLSILLMFWLFISPVGYQPPQQGLLAKLTAVNPVAPLLLTARDLMTNGSFKYLEGFLWVSGTCLVLLAVAWLLYRLSMPIIIERISA